MNYIKTMFLVAILLTVASFAPSFASAQALPGAVDPGDSTGSDAELSVAVDPGDSTGSGDGELPTAVDPGDSTGDSSGELPTAVDPGDSTGSGGDELPEAVDPGDSTGSGGTPSGNTGGGGGSGGGRTVASSGIIQISNIEVNLPGSSVPITSIIRGQTYVISWSASVRNVNTSIHFVPSAGASTFVGVSSNPNATNSFTWTVPATMAVGNYTLQFTDTAGRITSAPQIYTVPAFSAFSGAGVGAGTGATGQPSTGTGTGTGAGTGTGSNGQTGDEEVSGFPLVIGEEGGEGDPNSQLAAVGEADGFFSKYFLWFLILLLIIAGVILAREQRNKPNMKI